MYVKAIRTIKRTSVKAPSKRESPDVLMEQAREAKRAIEEKMSQIDVIFDQVKERKAEWEGGEIVFDEEAIQQKIKEEVRKNINVESIIQEILLRVPKRKEVDEKKLLKKLLSKIPDNKESLKIIRENIEVDPMAIIQKIMELPSGKFKIKSDQVDGLEQTMSAFRSQLGKGYLHGGGDTVAAGTNITIIPDSQGRKVISSTGGATLTEIEVAMGDKSSSKRFTITNATVVASNKILLFPSPSVATGRKGNDWEFDDVTLTGTAGTGNFLLTISSLYKMRGNRKIYYQIV